MSLTFRSTISETFQIVGRDSDGRTRVATATRAAGSNSRWDLRLDHPGGKNWQGVYHGNNIIDGLAELLVSREPDFKEAKGRGDRPRPDLRDDSRRVNDAAVSPVIPIARR